MADNFGTCEQCHNRRMLGFEIETKRWVCDKCHADFEAQEPTT